MNLSTQQLQAFVEVAQTGSMTMASRNLHVTQSALSQRIAKLESELETSLFIREPRQLRLTEAGEMLLKHCQVRAGLEQEFLEELNGRAQGKIGGRLRIGGFSSVMWSIIVPALSSLVKSNPAIRIEAKVRELGELPRLLRGGDIDFVVLNAPSERQGIASLLLGYEENVQVAPNGAYPEGRFIDHDNDDVITTHFHRKYGRSEAFERIYMDDIYGLIAGVSAGWGAAIVPRHLLEQCHGVRTINPEEKLSSPVYLHYHEQPYYSKLHEAVIAALTTGCRERLVQTAL